MVGKFVLKRRLTTGKDGPADREDLSKAPRNYDDRAIVYKTRFAGLLQGDLGRSTDFGDPVWNLIKGRIPVALYFGILTALITYGVCLPLGILKAIRHRTMIDNLTSVLIFVGYAIPGFALGALMLVYLGARGGWFPLFGLTDPNFDDMGTWDQFVDLLHHTAASALLRGGRLRLAYHDDEEQPHGQLGRRLREDGGRQRRVVPKRRFQACLPQFVYSHRLHPRTTDYHLGQREHPDRVRFRYSGVWASAVSGSSGQRPNGDHGNPHHRRLSPCVGQHSFRLNRGHGRPAG